MNPAEEIVKFWLQEKGYFLQSSVRLQRNKELDILALDKKGNKYHFEISVSVNSVVVKQTPKELAKEKYKKKFEDVSEEIRSKLGRKYKKVFITGNVGSKTNEFRNVFIKEMNILGVEVYKFEDILREILPYLENGNPLNPVIKTVQLTKFFG